jgi:hypothetical protein
MHRESGEIMFKLSLFLSTILLIMSCSSNQDKSSSWYSEDAQAIDRTKELFLCSKFLHIVGTQRPENRKKYEQLSVQAEELAFKIMPAYKEVSDNLKSELEMKYSNYGNYFAGRKVQEIGKDATGKVFPEFTQECYEAIKREELFENVEKLNSEFKKNQ